MYQKAPVDINKIPSLIEKYRGDLKFIPDANPYFIYKPRTGIKDNDSCFEQLNSVIENVKSIIFQKEDK
jgi:transcription-repair coupling factor (superfamily II helicase)